MDPAAFEAGIRDYNALVRAGKDTAFGRPLEKAAKELALDRGPRYASVMSPKLHHCMGGVTVNAARRRDRPPDPGALRRRRMYGRHPRGRPYRCVRRHGLTRQRSQGGGRRGRAEGLTRTLPGGAARSARAALTGRSRCTHDARATGSRQTMKKPAGRNGRSNRAMLDGRPFSSVLGRSPGFSLRPPLRRAVRGSSRAP